MNLGRKSFERWSNVNARQREVQSRGRSICSPMERVEMLAGVMGGKPSTGRPRLAAVSWKRETKRSWFPLGG